MRSTTIRVLTVAAALAAAATLLPKPAAEEAGVKPGSTPSAEFVGAEVCKGCHPREYTVWAGSSHARSFVALQTATGRKIAADATAYAGIPSARMLAECSPCHAPGMEIPASERPKGFHPEDGVQCESCHGPGGHYAKDEVMKDPKARTRAGLKKLRTEECLGCHRERPSHEILEKPKFDFDKMWPKVLHRNSARPARAGDAGS